MADIVMGTNGVKDVRSKAATMFANLKGMLVPAITLMLMFTMTMMGIVMVRLPVDVLFLNGGGITIDQLLFRILYRKIHRELYTKNEDGGGDSL